MVANTKKSKEKKKEKKQAKFEHTSSPRVQWQHTDGVCTKFQLALCCMSDVCYNVFKIGVVVCRVTASVPTPSSKHLGTQRNHHTGIKAQ